MGYTQWEACASRWEKSLCLGSSCLWASHVSQGLDDKLVSSMTRAEILKLFPHSSEEFILQNIDQPPTPIPAKKTIPRAVSAPKKEVPDVGVISFYIPIEPRPVQSGKRIGFNKKTGKKFIFTDKKTSQYYKSIEDIAKPLAPEVPWEGALEVVYEFFIARPKNLSRKCDPDEAIWCPQAKDLDNLIKGTQDSLTRSGFWKSDAQIVSLTALKKYSAKGSKGGFNVTIKPVK